jgi:hypothetical protein
MKKIILGGIAAVVIAVLAAVNVSLNSQNDNLLSDLALNNVEALASSERGCITRPAEDNGDCTSDGTWYFCENSFWFHDCVKGVY